MDDHQGGWCDQAGHFDGDGGGLVDDATTSTATTTRAMTTGPVWQRPLHTDQQRGPLSYWLPGPSSASSACPVGDATAPSQGPAAMDQYVGYPRHGYSTMTRDGAYPEAPPARAPGGSSRTAAEDALPPLSRKRSRALGGRQRAGQDTSAKRKRGAETSPSMARPTRANSLMNSVAMAARTAMPTQPKSAASTAERTLRPYESKRSRLIAQEQLQKPTSVHGSNTCSSSSNGQPQPEVGLSRIAPEGKEGMPYLPLLEVDQHCEREENAQSFPGASPTASGSICTTPSSDSTFFTPHLMQPQLPSVLLNRMRRPQKAASNGTRLVQRIASRFGGVHTGTVNTCRWSSTHGAFLATASMDQTVKIWDAFATVSDSPGCVATLGHHTGAVMDVRWNCDNSRILSGSFDKTVILTDLETCKPIHSFKHNEMITTVTWHPRQSDVFLVGAYSRGIVCWDSRSNSVVKQYKGMFGGIQSLEWIHDGSQFISSSDITRRNSIDKSILVWDFDAGAVVSNQVYLEAYTCPYLKKHPKGSHFVAQSNANYIAIFSTKAPYKLNKYKRFEGHKVDGYHIGCDISPDGSLVASGSADGSIHFYSWNSGKTIKVFERVHRNDAACAHVAFHPLHPQVVASCGWDGAVVLLGA